MEENLEHGEETLQQKDVVETADNQQTTEFATALAEAVSAEMKEDEETYLPLETYSGSTFVPSLDENREVVSYTPVNGEEGIVRIQRTGKSESQGGYVKSDDVSSNFGLDFTNVEENTQVSLVLANGKTLIGKVVKGKSRLGFYFPKKLAEQTLTLPPSGNRLPIRVVSLIVG